MSKTQSPTLKTTAAATVADTPGLLADLRQLIEQARDAAAVAVNAGLTQLYWRVGQRIRSEVLGDARAGYGQEILPTLSAELMPRYGRGFSARSLWRMVQFAEAFPNEAMVASLVLDRVAPARGVRAKNPQRHGASAFAHGAERSRPKMNTSSLVQKVWNFCHTLRASFSGQLVPQDPHDEPASALLQRIRAERAKRAPSAKARQSKPSFTRSPPC